MADDPRDQHEQDLAFLRRYEAERGRRARKNAIVSAIAAAIAFIGALTFDPEALTRDGAAPALGGVMRYMPMFFLGFAILQVGFVLFWLWMIKQWQGPKN